jgi:hypothetical protein
VVALALCVLVSSCSPAPETAPDTEFTLPLSEYTATDDERALVDRAYVVLLNQCLASRGQSRRVAEPAAPAEPTPLSWRYGVDDPTVAARYGYHLPPEYGDRGNAERERAQAAAPDGNTPEYLACVDDVQRQLGKPEGGGSYMDDVFAQSLGVTSVERSMADPRVRAALAQWSNCMRDKGHSATDPLTVVNDFVLTSEHPTPAEVSTATADVACKQDSDLVATWHGAEVDHQNSLIENNLERLEACRHSVDVAVRVATRTLGVPAPR